MDRYQNLAFACWGNKCTITLKFDKLKHNSSSISGDIIFFATPDTTGVFFL